MVEPEDSNMHKSKPKKTKKNIRLFWSALSIVVLLVFISCYYVYTKIIVVPSNTVKVNPKPYKEGPGGDPKQLTSYHDRAVAAWKAGDKQKAKDLAQKGLDQNKQLTIDQQGEVPSQANIMFDLYDISQGRYHE